MELIERSSLYLYNVVKIPDSWVGRTFEVELGEAFLAGRQPEQRNMVLEYM